MPLAYKMAAASLYTPASHSPQTSSAPRSRDARVRVRVGRQAGPRIPFCIHYRIRYSARQGARGTSVRS